MSVGLEQSSAAWQASRLGVTLSTVPSTSQWQSAQLLRQFRNVDMMPVKCAIYLWFAEMYNANICSGDWVEDNHYNQYENC